MTPFMVRVAEILGVDTDPESLPVPATAPSIARPVNEGADRQVAVRSLAEQLLCEANAVLAEQDDHLTLVDEVGDAELTFEVAYRGRKARVSTRFDGGVAVGEIVGDGVADTGPRELASPDALPDLLLLLLLEADVPRHPQPA
jgi:hypothetical protein